MIHMKFISQNSTSPFTSDSSKACNRHINLKPVIYIIDSDENIRDSLSKLVKEMGLIAKEFDCAEDFLSLNLEGGIGCLITEIVLPGLNGFQISEIIKKTNPDLAIVFYTADSSISNSVKAIKNGAFDFIPKSHGTSKLKENMTEALDHSMISRIKNKDIINLKNLHKRLTPREKEVLYLVTSGLLNKQIAAELGVSEITVKVHRKRVMEKMKTKSIVELVRSAEKLGISPEKNCRNDRYFNFSR